jgi:hypothetical protein
MGREVKTAQVCTKEKEIKREKICITLSLSKIKLYVNYTSCRRNNSKITL